MASIFPKNGVPAANANCAYQPENTSADCPARYYSANCNQRLDVDSLNATISELAAIKDLLCGEAWDCTKVTNIADALRDCLSGGGFMPCTDVLGTLDSRLTRQYIRTAGRLLNTSPNALSEIQDAAGWNVPEATHLGGHVNLGAAGWANALTGITGAIPTLNSTIKGYAGTINNGNAEITQDSLSVVSDFRVNGSSHDGGEIWILSGSIYVGCNIAENTTLEFRPSFYGNPERAMESIAYFFLGNAPQTDPGVTATHSAYYTAQSANIVQQTVASMVVNPGDRIGLVYVTMDSAVHAFGRLEFRLGSGTFVPLDNSTALTSVGLGVNSV